MSKKSKKKRKNKKVKSRCANCNQMNRYKNKKWKGKEKTKCIHCGKFLIKESDPPTKKIKNKDTQTKEITLCKEVKMKQNMNAELYEVIKPTRNNSNSKKSKKLWILGIIFIVFLLGAGYISMNKGNLTRDMVMAQLYPSNGTNLSDLNPTALLEGVKEQGRIPKYELSEEEIEKAIQEGASCYLNYSENQNQSLGEGH